MCAIYKLGFSCSTSLIPHFPYVKGLYFSCEAHSELWIQYYSCDNDHCYFLFFFLMLSQLKNAVRCGICMVGFSQPSLLPPHSIEVHQEPNARYLCPQCPRVFPRPAALTNHQRKKHQDALQGYDGFKVITLTLNLSHLCMIQSPFF